MKFCYIDESGTGNEPFGVMAGIIVDAKRMHITKAEWQELLDTLSGILGNEILEIHTRDFYPGNSPWRGLAGDVRARLITAVFDWLQLRKHKIVFTAVDKAKFVSEFPTSEFAAEVGTLWRFMALHICLAVQKHNQSAKHNKGHTVLIFDNEEREAADFIAMIRNPPNWTDAYYDRKGKQDRLDQIIDVPYFGDSRHVGLIQLADFVSYFIRRHLEIASGAVPPRYDGEDQLVDTWVNVAFERSIPRSKTFPARGRSGCADLFYSLAPTLVGGAA